MAWFKKKENVSKNSEQLSAESAAEAAAPVTTPAEQAAPVTTPAGKAAPVNAAHLTESDTERAEFEEFRRQKKVLELRRMLRTIDHTQLRQTATTADIKKLCAEAREYGFASVCVQPVYVARCRRFLDDCPQVKIACVVGFPMGENVTATKVYETKRAIADGADEIDMVICISAVKNGDYGYVKREVKKVVKAAKGSPVKVILETSLLTREEMLKAAACARDAGAAFLKTSTGFFGGGATAADVRALKDLSKGRCSVKASGGIRDADTFFAMLDAGADRIGTSAGTAIAEELESREQK